ncbi:hypothetical protein [Paenibacillus sp. NPDC058174]|uniref:hypothetical protein n=1 Tax=Paenibacillus sp. NPDC058174 TaxID=3346366 RepID=UPI0036DEE7E0
MIYGLKAAEWQPFCVEAFKHFLAQLFMRLEETDFESLFVEGYLKLNMEYYGRGDRSRVK